MYSSTTDGMASAYLFTQSTSFTELEHNPSNTSGDMFINILPIIEEKDLQKLIESEYIYIQIPPEHDSKAFYLLSLKCQFQSLANSAYGLKKADLIFLEEAGIPYDIIKNM